VPTWRRSRGVHEEGLTGGSPVSAVLTQEILEVVAGADALTG
jgi:hypothetical protein